MVETGGSRTPRPGTSTQAAYKLIRPLALALLVAVGRPRQDQSVIFL